MNGRTIETEVLVIGGGATGAGVARDAAMRGFATVLAERGDLAEGTTGRFHGLIHSGARYAVKDPSAARECIDENLILRRIAAGTMEDTGGLFVTTPWDDPAYADRLMAACADVGIPVEDVPPAEVRREEPRLNPAVTRALRVPDASIDVWRLVWANAESAEAHGGCVLRNHPVTSILREGDAVVGAVLHDRRGGSEVTVRAAVTVNATGAWAGRLAAMAGCEGVTVVPGKGIMIAMNHRLVHTVVNRCAMPADGDILVPVRTVCVIGTTDSPVPDPDDLPVTPGEVAAMLDAGERLVPGFRQARALRVWAGVRPLFSDTKDGGVTDTRDLSRSHVLLDHRERDGIGGFVTITSGKATTYRLMAEHSVDAVERQIGVRQPCRTADEPLPGSEDGEFAWPAARLARREESLHDRQILCECELVTRERFEQALADRPTVDLDDIRRALRLGMGPCQGGFCTYRAAGILHAAERLDAATADQALVAFLQERWKGVAPILYGDQLRQARLDDWLYQGVLDIGHLPPHPTPLSDRATGTSEGQLRGVNEGGGG